jgi:hypothetical protein
VTGRFIRALFPSIGTTGTTDTPGTTGTIGTIAVTPHSSVNTERWSFQLL